MISASIVMFVEMHMTVIMAEYVSHRKTSSTHHNACVTTHSGVMTATTLFARVANLCMDVMDKFAVLLMMA